MCLLCVGHLSRFRLSGPRSKKWRLRRAVWRSAAHGQFHRLGLGLSLHADCVLARYRYCICNNNYNIFSTNVFNLILFQFTIVFVCPFRWPRCIYESPLPSIIWVLQSGFRWDGWIFWIHFLRFDCPRVFCFTDPNMCVSVCAQI